MHSLENFLIPFGGGMLIGFAALLLFILNGRVAGISGILGSIEFKRSKENLWRVAFLTGMIFAAMGLFASGFLNFPETYQIANVQVIVAGLLVGFGTRLGSGCTSGHGVCGVSRLSKRSLIATAVFMFSGILTVMIFQ